MTTNGLSRALTGFANAVPGVLLVFLSGIGAASGEITLRSAETKAASNIGVTSVTLNGYAQSPSKENVTIRFDFGTSMSYGKTISANWISPTTGVGSISGKIAADVTTLQCNTTYHFRAKISNDTVTWSHGANSTFSTPSCYVSYRFDDAALTDGSIFARTLTANGNNGAVPLFSTQSPARGNAVSGTCGYRSFNRANQTYLSLPETFPNLGAQTHAFTISAWIRTTDNTQKQRIFVDDVNKTGGYGLSLGDAGPGQLRFYSRKTGNQYGFTLDTTNVIENNQWYFVAATIPVTQKSIYVFDSTGRLLAKAASVITNEAFASDSGLSSIGGEASPSSNTGTAITIENTGFSGDIDEVTVYGSALDETELQTAMAINRRCADITSHSTLVAVPTTVAADGASTSTLSVTLKSASGTSLTGKTVALSANSGSSVISPATAVTDSTGVATFTVKDTVPETVIYTATNVSDGIVIAATATVTFANYALDAVDEGKAAGTTIRTKLAGSSFNLDVLDLGTKNALLPSGFTGNVSVDLVEDTAGACGTTSLGCTIEPSPYTYTTADAKKKTFSFKCTQNSPNVRVSLKNGSKTFCSRDNFAIRPKTFTVTSTANADATGIATTATPTLKAGTAFSLTATAGAGYSGTPKLDTKKIEVAKKTADMPWTKGSLSGTFGAADITTGAAIANNAIYSEVGYFRLDAGGIHDKDFTVADQEKGDCTADYSNVADTDGKIGCYFGNSEASNYFGRFIPDHFTTTVTAGCSTFTYSGQPFTVTVNALNEAASITRNYDSAAGNGFSKEVTLSDGTDRTTPPAPGTLTNNTLAATLFTDGSASTSSPIFSFKDSPSVPDAIQIRATETSDSTVTSKSFTEGSTPIRSGRIALYHAIGSELLPLKVPLSVQHYTLTKAWQPNPDDSCSTISANNFTFDFTNSGLLACDTAISVTGTAPSQTLTLSAPVSAKTGWTTLTLKLGSSATGTTCVAAGAAGPTETPANKPWLQFNWKGSGVADPSARASFGWRKPGPILYLRERY